MDKIVIGEHEVPADRYYRDGYDEKGAEREVAFYADGKYMTRGSWSEARAALRYTNHGSIGWFIRNGHDVKLQLDEPTFGSMDTKNLCWCGPKLSVEEFGQWLSKSTLMCD